MDWPSFFLGTAIGLCVAGIVGALALQFVASAIVDLTE